MEEVRRRGRRGGLLGRETGAVVSVDYMTSLRGQISLPNRASGVQSRPSRLANGDFVDEVAVKTGDAKAARFVQERLHP